MSTPIKRRDWQNIIGCDIDPQQGIWQVRGYDLRGSELDAWDQVQFWTHGNRVYVKNWPLPDDATSPLTGESLSAEAVAAEVGRAIL